MEDLKDNAIPSKRSRFICDPKKNREVIFRKVITKLKDVVKDDRSSIIQQQVKAHPVTVDGLTVVQSDLLCNAFHDESCWSNATLNSPKLIKELAKLGVLNPFTTYKITCINMGRMKFSNYLTRPEEYFRSDLSHKSACDKDKNLTCRS